MIDPQKAIKKLRRPPNVQNWVKNLRKRTDDMAVSLYNTALNAPRHSLKPVTDIVSAVVVDSLSDEQALNSAARITNARTKAYAHQILPVLLPYIRNKGWKGVQVFKGMVEWYRVAANVNVPVKPTFILNDAGKLTPYFLICWTTIGLSDYQKRILSTLISEALLSLEDFQSSDAVILCVPRYPFSKTERFVVQWKLSDFEPLRDNEKEDLFARYGRALETAERMILESLS